MREICDACGFGYYAHNMNDLRCCLEVANGWYVGARAAEEDNKRLEALVRAKDETIGELLELIPDGLGDGTWTRIDPVFPVDRVWGA